MGGFEGFGGILAFLCRLKADSLSGDPASDNPVESSNSAFEIKLWLADLEFGFDSKLGDEKNGDVIDNE